MQASDWAALLQQLAEDDEHADEQQSPQNRAGGRITVHDSVEQRLFLFRRRLPSLAARRLS
jgi:hypothetical protein